MYKRTRTLFVSLFFALASQAQNVTNIRLCLANDGGEGPQP